MKPHQRILEQIYDVLAHNTQYVEPDYIADKYEMMLDFENDIITLYDEETQDEICTLKIEYAEKEA